MSWLKNLWRRKVAQKYLKRQVKDLIEFETLALALKPGLPESKEELLRWLREGGEWVGLHGTPNAQDVRDALNL